MKRKVIISVAPVKAGDAIDSGSLAKDIEQCVKEGASMCHLHSRLQEGELSEDTTYLVECFEKIREKTDVVIQVSTGGISNMTIEQRCKPLEYDKAETASLNGGSTNLGEAIYNNCFEDIRYCANMSYERGIIPEVEVFDIGMIHNIERLKKEEHTNFKEPIMYNLVFGHQGGMQATVQSLYAFQSFVPQDAIWGVTHYGRQDWSFLATALAMGASLVRIGFEDSRYMDDRTTAKYNYALVQKLVEIIHVLGLEVASVKEARNLMGI